MYFIRPCFQNINIFHATFLGLLYRVGFICLPFELLVHDILGNTPMHFIHFS